jgi:1-hydroxycarotenoid 3,4-desaturase
MKSRESRSARERVVIVGAGMGGLACAIDLAAAGIEVTVVERAEHAGGKMREAVLGAARIDSGPTVLTMRWVFDALFEHAGASLDSHVALRPTPLLARHAWNETERLDLFADVDRSTEAIGDFAGAAEAAGYRAFCAEARRIFDTLRDSFLTAQKAGPIGLARSIGFDRPDALFGIRPFETLWQALGAHFHDPRLRQLFGRYATYCGASPFAAPATLMLIAHVEQAGVWLVDGGMQRLAEALEALAMSLGVTFRYGAHVERIDLERGRASGVTLQGGERLAASAVVVNADASAITGGAFGAEVAGAVPAKRGATRSLSAVTWALEARARGFPLARHNVFFSDDYAAEFDDLFKRGRLPGAPTIYVCAQDRGEAERADTDRERLFILVNAPADGDRRDADQEELAACETRVFNHLTRCGLDIDRTGEPRILTTPRQFEAMFPKTGGALYGQATHGWAAAFERPGARTRAPGLYLAGGGAHPGAGIPMATLSGRLAAQCLIKDLGSTRRFHPAAMAGGM